MTEYLNAPEMHQLTGYARAVQQGEWLKSRSIPHRMDGRRVIVSRVHVQAWLEGRAYVPTGLNLRAVK